MNTAIQTETTPREKIETCARELGLTMESIFVPFSQSRHKDEKDPSLNWRIELSRQGRVILRTDYSAGCGHCPSYKVSIKTLGGRDSVMRREYINFECEQGKTAREFASMQGPLGGQAILPDFASVLYSLAMDSDVLNYSSFESWAGEFGYDPDSRKGESTYRACLEIALQLRAAIGDKGLEALRDACAGF